MAEQQTEVPFDFFERKGLKLRFHFDEYLQLESSTGVAPTDFVANIMKLSPASLRLALFIGLKWQEAPGVRKVITLDWVGKQLQKHLGSGQSLMPILRALDEAFTVSGYFQPETPVEEGDLKGPTNGGGPSGSTPPLHLVNEASSAGTGE